MYQPSAYPLSAINHVSPLMSGVHVMNRFPRQSIYGIHGAHQAISVVVPNQPLGLPVQGCYTHPPPPYGHIRSAREVKPSRLLSQDRTHCPQRPVAHSLSSVLPEITPGTRYLPTKHRWTPHPANSCLTDTTYTEDADSNYPLGYSKFVR